MRIENPFENTLTDKYTPSLFFLRQQSFSFFPARVATGKINLGVGVLVQDPMIVMTLNLTGWHLQVRRCVWNRILSIVRNENWKPSKTSRTSTHPIYFFLCQQSFSFFPARVATRKINLGVGVLVQDPMIVMTLVQFPSDICSYGCVCFAAVVQGQGRCTGSFRAP